MNKTTENRLGGELRSQQAARHLLEELRRGRYADAAQLPSELELADVLGVSRTVVRDALSDLERDGYVERVRGIGTLVNRDVVRVENRMDQKLEFNRMIRSIGRVPHSDNLMVTRETATPELMERLGTLLRTSTDGVLQLLLTRQEFKRGLRSEVTMISTEANNPLKFSPSVEVALAHLLGPGVRGFMPAEEAMSNAFADLRAHQFGVMVGLRAAFAHVLEVFTPEKLEQRIADKSRLDALFTANRKARLWDQFCQLYAGIATEAEDDFHSLFGKAFAKAYDEQMERFRSGG